MNPIYAKERYGVVIEKLKFQPRIIISIPFNVAANFIRAAKALGEIELHTILLKTLKEHSPHILQTNKL